MGLLERICSRIGHKLKNTLVITESEDFYDVDWARYCVRCGNIVEKTEIKLSPKDFLKETVSRLR